jgi:hypothetical protein
MKVRIFFGKGFFPLLFSSLLTVLFLTGCAEDSHILDNGQNRQLEFSVSTHGWDNSNKSSNQKVTSRATPISTFDTSKNFNVIADINNGDNWSTEVNNETVSYSTTNKIWQTTATHYWPGVGSTVNFYAYYPTSILNNITHTTGSTPVFSYTVPDNAANQIDILSSSKTSVAGNSYSQTPVDFKHIFAAVKFSVGTSGMPSGTISKVTLNNILYRGTYSLGGTWAPNITDKKSFSQVVSASTNTGTAITSDATTFMMMPQTLSDDASITLTYSNGGTLTKAITGTWEAGKTYTYNLSKTIPVANFDYTGDVQSYTVPLTGTYKLEVWGAQGGEVYEGGVGGYGGYSYGNIMLKGGDFLYICVGGSGASGGYNGGGKGDVQGGGASHIAIINRGMLNEYISHQEEVVIVAGGGGSGERSAGGNGGGISGESSTTTSYPSGAGGNQTLGGISVAYPDYINSSALVNGSFGQGGCGYTPTPDNSQDYGAGGGGGWYGGGGTSYDGAGGGGSGHLSSSLISGTIGMQNGIRSGNGYARITFVSAN